MGSFKERLEDDHLAIFEWFVKEWASHFGVDLRWLIYVRWAEDAEDSAANVYYDDDARHAVVQLTRDYSGILPLGPMVLARYACHEIVHILLAPIAELAEQGVPRGVKTIGLEHEIVQTLVQISMRDHYDRLRASCPIKA
ncbi:hypothetical protein [Paraburkholderia sp. GAS82]|uniref:hypothetical protein n=1 Tax=Paraburkholderia sp. GAS82 TaxID=3035137 RepID=UPI003D22EEFE